MGLWVLCKLLKVLEILNPFFPIDASHESQIPSNEPFVCLPPDGADRGINQTHANIIPGQAEIGWGEREKLNMEAYLFLHNFVSFLLAVRDQTSEEPDPGIIRGKTCARCFGVTICEGDFGERRRVAGRRLHLPRRERNGRDPQFLSILPALPRAFVTATSFCLTGGFFSFSISSPPTLQPSSGGLSPLPQSAPAGPFAFVSH